MAATNLAIGDVAIIGYNSGMSDGTGRPPVEDKIHFVLLKAIGSGTQIFFTDRAWTGTAFTNAAGDGTFVYTAGADLAAGTVITITQAQLSAAGFDLNHTTGEAIYVYQGTDANTPTRFIYALEAGDGNATFGASLAGTGLTAGFSAVSIAFDAGAYNGPTSHAASFLFNGNGTTLLHAISDATHWIGDDQDSQNALEQHVQFGPWLRHADIDFWGTTAVNGLVRTSADSTVSGGADDFNQASLYRHFGGASTFNSARDIVFDTVDGKFFVADSNISGVNRILQGNIADLITNPGQAPTLITLFSYTQVDGADLSGRLDNMEVDLVNNIVYFTRGDNLEKVNYNTANQTSTVLFNGNVSNATSPSGFGNPAGSTSNFFNDMVINFATGDVYMSSTRVLASAGGDNITKNFIYHLSGLTAGSGTDAFQFNGTNTGTARLLPFVLNDDAHNPIAGTTSSPASTANAPYFFAQELGTLDGLAIDPVTNTLYFSTGEIIFDHDGTSATAPIWTPGIVASYALSGNPTGAINILYQQTAQFGGVIYGLMGDLEIDTNTGHWYVIDYNGLNGVNDDHHIWRGNLSGASTPTQFTSTIGDINGLTTVGFTLNHAPTMSASALAATAVETPGAGSGESSQPLLFGSVVLSDIDTAIGDELSGAVVRIAGNFQSGAGHQDFLRLQGNLSGTTASGISYAYNQTTGAMVLTGAATVAEYQAAIALITFSVSGDNPTNYGTATTRVIAVSVSDGLSLSDEVLNTVNVPGVNDAPVNTIPGAPASGAEDSSFSVAGLSISDVDADPATQVVTVTLTVTRGILTIATNVANGLTAGQVTSNGTASITLTGTQNQINATLANPSALQYLGTANLNGLDTLTIVTNDGGQNGTGGALSDSDVLNVNVLPVNDAPSLAAAGPTAASTEQVQAVLDADLTVADIDLDQRNVGAGDYAGSSFTVARQGGANAQDTYGFNTAGAGFTVSGANLQVGGQTFATFTTTGGTLSISFTGMALANSALVDQVLQRITYANASDTPPANVTLAYNFNDGAPGGGQGAGAASTASGTIAVTITPVNDAPTAVADTGSVLSFGTTSGNVLTNDSDVEGDTVTATPGVTTGTYGSLTMGANGAWTYQANNAAGVLAGDTVQDVLAYTALDPNGGSTPSTLTITITGRSIGTAGPDAITGNGTNNSLQGLGDNDTLNGGGGDDTIDGGGGNDTLIGGTGADNLIGGSGDDRFEVDAAGDTVVEAGGGGTDVIVSTASYTIAANVEAMRIQGTGLTGTGSSGVDLLVSAGGANTLIGLTGDDVYVVNTVGDVVTEGAAAGYDVVVATISYTIPNEVELLVLRGTGLTATGNGAANTFRSESGGNVIAGGGGDDTYLVGGGDIVNEAAGGGMDRVFSGFSFVLPDEVEQLFVQGAGLTGTGNAGDNLLVSEGGANTLVGLGGNDVYLVNTVADVVTEDALEGYDLMVARVSATIAVNVEGLIVVGTGLTATGGGVGDLLISEGSGNTLTGGGGDDYLLAGAKSDALSGGLGGDAFAFRSLNGIVLADRFTVTDFDASTGDGVDLSRIDAITGGIDDAFTIGALANGQAGRLQIDDLGGGVMRLSGDVNGDGVADFVLDVTIAPGGSWSASNIFL